MALKGKLGGFSSKLPVITRNILTNQEDMKIDIECSNNDVMSKKLVENVGVWANLDVFLNGDQIES